MIGARYWVHSFADCSQPWREADSIAPQMNWTVSAKFTGARMPVIALCAGW